MHSKIRGIVFCLLSFVLSFVLLLLSISVMLEATILNPSYILDNMNTTNYFTDKKDEITRELVDLGYASGLEESFFGNVVETVTIHDDTEDYLESYYNGGSAKISTVAFRQRFNSELDSYIKKNNVKVASSDSREYLINKAASVYEANLRIPMFSMLSPYLTALKDMMPLLIGGLVVFAAILCVKHRAVRYICYATSGTFITVGIIPAVLFSTGYVSKINIESRAFYNLFVRSMNSVLIALAICSAVFLIISIGLFFLHKNMRKHASEE